jgi:hypothetical protein
LTSAIYTQGVTRDTPPLVLVDPDRFLDLTARLEAPGRLEWDFSPEPRRLTLAAADRLAAQIQAVEAARRSAPSSATPTPPWPP